MLTSLFKEKTEWTKSDYYVLACFPNTNWSATFGYLEKFLVRGVLRKKVREWKNNHSIPLTDSDYKDNVMTKTTLSKTLDKLISEGVIKRFFIYDKKYDQYRKIYKVRLRYQSKMVKPRRNCSLSWMLMLMCEGFYNFSGTRKIPSDLLDSSLLIV